MIPGRARSVPGVVRPRPGGAARSAATGAAPRPQGGSAPAAGRRTASTTGSRYRRVPAVPVRRAGRVPGRGSEADVVDRSGDGIQEAFDFRGHSGRSQKKAEQNGDYCRACLQRASADEHHQDDCEQEHHGEGDGHADHFLGRNVSPVRGPGDATDRVAAKPPRTSCHHAGARRTTGPGPGTRRSARADPGPAIQRCVRRLIRAAVRSGFASYEFPVSPRITAERRNRQGIRHSDRDERSKHRIAPHILAA